MWTKSNDKIINRKRQSKYRVRVIVPYPIVTISLSQFVKKISDIY